MKPELKLVWDSSVNVLADAIILKELFWVEQRLAKIHYDTGSEQVYYLYEHVKYVAQQLKKGRT